jgi:hypothetical protein
MAVNDSWADDAPSARQERITQDPSWPGGAPMGAETPAKSWYRDGDLALRGHTACFFQQVAIFSV